MKKLVVILSIIMIFGLIGCTNQSTVDKKDLELEELQNKIERYEQKIKELEENNSSYEIRIRNFEEERDTYKSFIDKATKYLDEDEIVELARGEWVYNIEVDGQSVPPDGEVEVYNNNFEIIYSERQSIISMLNHEILEHGIISEDYIDHLEIIDAKPKEINRTDGTVVTGFIYEFENIPSNTSFNIEISDELKDRLNLNTNTISIYIK